MPAEESIATTDPLEITQSSHKLQGTLSSFLWIQVTFFDRISINNLHKFSVETVFPIFWERFHVHLKSILKKRAGLVFWAISVFTNFLFEDQDVNTS